MTVEAVCGTAAAAAAAALTRQHEAHLSPQHLGLVDLDTEMHTGFLITPLGFQERSTAAGCAGCAVFAAGCLSNFLCLGCTCVPAVTAEGD
jgi:hypothetical protein